MKWIEMDLFLPKQEATDLVALVLYECGSNGSILQEGLQQDEVRITAYFSEGQENIRQTVQEKLAELSRNGSLTGPWRIELTQADDQSWMYEWQKYFHPKKITERFWVEPAWERAVSGPDELVLTIDPGLAFGSGIHDTTSLCIACLEKFVKPGDTVIDIGTGTGILAIAAALLGARQVTAVDLDEVAVAQAQKNITLNGVEEQVTASCSDLLDAVTPGRAQVIVANIVTDAILALLPQVSPFMVSGGMLIVSGIIDERIGEIRQAANQWAFDIVEEHYSGGWYAVVMRWQS
jgi:ribosomal protein L11 methyltransferase